MSQLLAITAGTAVPRGEVPSMSASVLREECASVLAGGGRLCALFAIERPALELWVVLAHDTDRHLSVGRCPWPSGPWQSWTADLPQAHLFERELAETWGLEVQGHPWLKPVRSAPARRVGPGNSDRAATVGTGPLFRIDHDALHEVAVGPVHAGVIEPGHFRFQCAGEVVHHLEIALGYQHRGVERALLGGDPRRVRHLVECAAGDTTIAHTTAWALVTEALAGAASPPRADILRGVALELERLANHTGDLGALAGDVGYQGTQAYCGRLRGDWLNLSAALCGNRFGRAMVRPGGVRFDVEPERAARAAARVDLAWADLEPSIALLWGSASVLARFEDCGRVSRETATALGVVGVAARASGLPHDARHDHPTGAWKEHAITTSTWTSGDVFARAWVRGQECVRSQNWVKARLLDLPDGPIVEPVGAPRPGHVAVGLIEGWRGEVCHVGFTGVDGTLDGWKIVDPSFHNWNALAMALRGQQISDFPLCNKSFSLSYCGFDL